MRVRSVSVAEPPVARRSRTDIALLVLAVRHRLCCAVCESRRVAVEHRELRAAYLAAAQADFGAAQQEHLGGEAVDTSSVDARTLAGERRVADRVLLVGCKAVEEAREGVVLVVVAPHVRV